MEWQVRMKNDPYLHGHRGAVVKIVWVIAISTAIVFINFLKWLGEFNFFFN